MQLLIVPDYRVFLTFKIQSIAVVNPTYVLGGIGVRAYDDYTYPWRTVSRQWFFIVAKD